MKRLSTSSVGPRTERVKVCIQNLPLMLDSGDGYGLNVTSQATVISYRFIFRDNVNRLWHRLVYLHERNICML